MASLRITLPTRSIWPNSLWNITTRKYLPMYLSSPSSYSSLALGWFAPPPPPPRPPSTVWRVCCSCMVPNTRCKMLISFTHKSTRFSYNHASYPLIDDPTNDEFYQLWLRYLYFLVAETVGDFIIRFIIHFVIKVDPTHVGKSLTILNYRTRFLFAMFVVYLMCSTYYSMIRIQFWLLFGSFVVLVLLLFMKHNKIQPTFKTDLCARDIGDCTIGCNSRNQWQSVIEELKKLFVGTFSLVTLFCCTQKKEVETNQRHDSAWGSQPLFGRGH